MCACVCVCFTALLYAYIQRFKCLSLGANVDVFVRLADTVLMLLFTAESVCVCGGVYVCVYVRVFHCLSLCLHMQRQLSLYLQTLIWAF